MKINASILIYQCRKRHIRLNIFRNNASHLWFGRTLFYPILGSIDPISMSSDHIMLVRGSTLPKLLAEIKSQEVLTSSYMICICGDIPTNCRSIFTDSQVLMESTILAFPDDEDYIRLINLLQEIFDKYDAWDSSMNYAIWTHERFQTLFDLSDDIIHSPVSLLDNSYAFIAFSRKKSQEMGLVTAYVNDTGKMYVDDIDSLSTALAGLNASASRPEEVFELRNDQNVLVFSANVYNEQNEHMATLMTAVFDEQEYILHYAKTILGLMRNYVSDLYLSNGSLYHSDQTPNKSHMVLRDTLSGIIVPISEWQDTMSVIGWNNEDRLQFIIFKSDLRYDPKSFSQYLCPEIEALWRCCICIEFDHDIVLLFNLTLFEKESSESPRNEIIYFQRENLLKSGISREFKGYNGINAAYKQASFAIKYGNKANPSIWAHEFDTYAYNYLLLHGKGSFTPAQVCAPEILLLKEHDKRHETSYYQTLHAYFECGFNASSTARALYIHRSTFLDRMTRIYEITRLTPAALENLNVRNYLGISFSICDSADNSADNETGK